MTVASAQSNPLSSSHALMSGMPAFVAGTSAFLDRFASMIIEAMQQATAVSRRELIETARRTAGWEEVAPFLTIDFDGEHIRYGVSNPAMIPKVMELEFGTQNESPTGLLRKMAINQAHRMGAVVTSVLDREVPIG